MPFHLLSRLSSYLHIRSVDPIIYRSHFVLLFSPLSHSLSPPLHALTVAKINQNKINISAERPDSIALHLFSLSLLLSMGWYVLCVYEWVSGAPQPTPSHYYVHSIHFIVETGMKASEKRLQQGGRRGRNSQCPLSAQVRHTTHTHVVSCHTIITPSLNRLKSILYPHHTCIICTSTIRSRDPNASISSPLLLPYPSSSFLP